MSAGFLVSYAALWILFILQCLFILALLRQVGVLHLRIQPLGARIINAGPEIGEPAPSLSLHDLDDVSSRLQVPSDDARPILLVFVSPNCPACNVLMPGVRALARRPDGDLLWAVVALGVPSECARFRKKHNLRRMLFCQAPEDVRDQYAVTTTPYVVLLDRENRVVTKGIANHVEHLESILARNAFDDEDSFAVKAPAAHLIDRDYSETSLQEQEHDDEDPTASTA